MKISLNISDDLRNQAEHKAISMGLNLSGYIRSVVSEDIRKFREKIDFIAMEAEKDESELVPIDDYIAKLDRYISDAQS